MPREKIYEEWKAEQQQKNAEKANFNTRKPGEGADQKIYQKLVQIKEPVKKAEQEEESDEATQHVGYCFFYYQQVLHLSFKSSETII